MMMTINSYSAIGDKKDLSENAFKISENPFFMDDLRYRIIPQFFLLLGKPITSRNSFMLALFSSLSEVRRDQIESRW
jgi:hypothetical protein